MFIPPNVVIIGFDPSTLGQVISSRNPIKNGKRRMLGHPSVHCWLLWFLSCCSMFLPYLWCFMWWGFWDYFAPNFHLMVWFKMRGIIVEVVGVLCLCLGGDYFIILWINHFMLSSFFHPTSVQPILFALSTTCLYHSFHPSLLIKELDW